MRIPIEKLEVIEASQADRRGGRGEDRQENKLAVALT
jgi:hypothetical protein